MTRRRGRRATALATIATAAGLAVSGPGVSAAWAVDTPAGEVVTLPAPSDSCVGAAPTRAASATWTLRRLAPELLWPLTRGSGVTVGVVDTGVSSFAPPLAGAVRSGWDVVRGGPADDDCAGRGTALAGVIAARPVTGSPFAGLAPGATILPVRVTDGRGQFNAQTLADGIATAAAGGSGVILVGTGVPTDTAELRAAVQDAVRAGALIVAPVNPQGPSGGRPPVAWYPAAYDDVLGVGDLGANGTAPQPSPIVGCDLLAPGSGAISIAPVGDGHYAVGGTAVAAAHVAGVATLIRAYHPDLAPSAVRQRLLATAESLPGHAPALDAYAAVTATGPSIVATTTGGGGGRVLPATPVESPKPGRAATFLAGGLALLVVVLLAIGAVRATRRRDP